MTLLQNRTRSFLTAVLTLALGLAAPARGQTVLLDFGNDSSYRGVSVVNPDLHGNYWNSVLPGATVANLVDNGNQVTPIDLVFSTEVGTDSYNGPAGVTSGPTPAEIAATDIDANALGILGVTNAAIDYAAGAPGAVRFELQELDPAKTYNLTFFGSHKYNTDNVTRYSVYTDNTFSTVVASADLTVGVNNNHNRDTVVTLTNLSPQVGNKFYVQFVGTGGNLGYLNCLELTVYSATNLPPVATSGSYAVVERGQIVIAVGDLVLDPNGDTVAFSSVGDTDPADYGLASITDGGATLTYTNTTGAPGSVDTFDYVVSDGVGGTATNTVSIRINAVNGLSLVSAGSDGTFAYLTYAALPDSRYALDWTPNLDPPINWLEMQVKMADSSGELRFTNLLAPPPTNSFFRVRSVAPERGASLPYLTYQAEDGTYGNGALLKGPSMDETLTESEASGRQYVELNQTDAFVEWTVQAAARGMVLRFTMPDAPTGGGTSATLGLYVDDSRVASLALTSRFAWQYFPYSPAPMDPSNDPTVNPRPRMRFDDARYIFPSALHPGDVIRLQKDAQDTSPAYGIDLIELEPIPDAMVAPPGSLDVTQPPYNAVPDDSGDDASAFNSCATDAGNQGKPMYIPPGEYDLSQSFKLTSVEVQGAGVWYTQLHFTKPGNSGVLGQGGRIAVHDLYLTTENTSRSGSHGIGGYYGSGSVLSNLWIEHFVTGAWIADYSGLNHITDGLLVSGCRFRNTYADGLNFAKGTRNSTVENSHFRNNGDDAMATWPSDTNSVPETSDNTFRFDTVENTWRAAGLGIFGGSGHVAHDCVFRDVAGQAGIRFNTVFPGYPFSTNSEMVVSNMTLVRTSCTDLWGNQLGAVTFQTVNSPVRGIHLTNLDIIDSQRHGIYYETSNIQPITNVVFNTVLISNAAQYGIYVRNGAGGWSENSFVTVTNSGAGPVWDYSSGFDLRKIEGNVGW